MKAAITPLKAPEAHSCRKEGRSVDLGTMSSALVASFSKADWALGTRLECADLTRTFLLIFLSSLAELG